MTRLNRRLYLALLGAAVAPLAGCSDAESNPERPDGNGDSGSERPDGAADPTGGNVTDADADADADADGDPAVHEGYDTTDVRVVRPTGEELGSVTAAIADTPDLRYLGLSDTEYLPEDRGMLFVFESVEERTFVMRGMDFGIDIVYADSDGTITAIHHAPEPGPDEDGNEQAYDGRGQYVLEVSFEWTSERGVSEGDRLELEL